MPTTIWKGRLSFGLVTIPVKLYRAARAEKVSFHQLYRGSRGSRPQAPDETEEPAELTPPPARGRKSQAAQPPQPVAPLTARQQPAEVTPREARPTAEPPLSRIRQSAYVPDSEEGAQAPVSRKDLVRGYEYDRGQYVVITDEDLKSITPETRKDAQILEFVHLSEVDPVYFESSYYVLPDGGGETAYALLFEALRQTGYAALAELAMHRREHVAIIRPGPRGLLAHTMYYSSEVKSEEEFRTDTSLVKPRELEMAKMLVESLAAKFEPGKYRDTYREKLEAMIHARVEGRQVAPVAAAPKAEKVVDIMDALQKSLASLKKPAASEAPVAAKPRTQKRAGRG